MKEQTVISVSYTHLDVYKRQYPSLWGYFLLSKNTDMPAEAHSFWSGFICWFIWDSSAARTCRLRGSGTISLRAYLKPQPSIMLPLRSLGHYFLAGDGVALPVGRPWSLISFPIKSLKSRERALAGFVTSHSQPRLFLSQPCSSYMLVILKGLCSGLLS